jgi:hypothetical protein
MSRSALFGSASAGERTSSSGCFQPLGELDRQHLDGQVLADDQRAQPLARADREPDDADRVLGPHRLRQRPEGAGAARLRLDVVGAADPVAVGGELLLGDKAHELHVLHALGQRGVVVGVDRLEHVAAVDGAPALVAAVDRRWSG